MTAPIVTLFADNKGTRILADTPMDLAEVERVIREAAPANAKGDLPLLKFAKFTGTKAPGCSSLRSDASVVEVTGIEADYDAGKKPMREAVEECRKAGIAALFYTSASHTPERPRYRAVVPLTTALRGTPEQLRASRRHWVGVLNAILGGVLASESFTLSQSFYYGRIKGQPDPEIVRLEGLCIDEMPDAPEPVFPAKSNGKDTAAPDPTTDEELKQAFARADGRYEAMKKLSARWAARGMQKDDIEAALHSLLDTSPKANTNTKNLRKQVVVLARTAVKKFGETRRHKERADRSTLAAVVNKHHALIYVNGGLRVMWKREQDGALPRLSSVADIRTHYRNQQTGRINPFDAWLESPDRAEYNQFVFRPGVLDVGRDYNLFAGWGVEPVRGDCSLFLEHLRVVICGRDESLFQYVLQWLANLFQDPGNKPGTAWTMGSAQGAGKGSIWRYLFPILGCHAAQLTGNDLLLGRFNDIIARKLLLFGDESAWPGDRRGIDKLKSYITEEWVTIERKNVPAFMIENHARFIFPTNRAHSAPAEIDDRRFVVLPVDESRINDDAYWEALTVEQKGSGPAALLHYLLHDVKITVNLRRIPKTEAHADQKLLGLEPHERFWRWLLMKNEHTLLPRVKDGPMLQLKFGEPINTATLHEFYLDWCRNNVIRHPTSLDGLAKMSQRLVGSLGRREARVSERRDLQLPDDARVYALPDLMTLRRKFEEKIGRALPWGDGDPDQEEGM